MKQKILFCICIVLAALLLFLGFYLDAKNEESIYFQNGVRLRVGKMPDFLGANVQEIRKTAAGVFYINHPQGYSLKIPKEAKADLSLATLAAKFTSPFYDLTVSYELFPVGYEPVSYIAEYPNRYMLAPSFLEKNNIELFRNDFEEINGIKTQIIALERTPYEGSEITRNAYVYCYLYTSDVDFYRLVFRADHYSEDLMDAVFNTLHSFNPNEKKQGTSALVTNFAPEIPENWTQETRDLYESIKTSDSVLWGAFVPQGVRDGNSERVHALEDAIDYQFDVMLEYGYHFQPFPTEGLERIYAEGKICELTMQIASVMNENLDGHNPVFELIDGVHDETLRAFARDAAAFGKPFIFRLNNEMNSDWVSYGATACLNDPDIYIRMWRHIYDIFEEEGAHNAIWVFNPNNNNYPPQAFNDALLYYPGNRYVQLYGVTGYNTGDYFRDVTGEKWSSFTELYDFIESSAMPYFSEFPWMITEFASSSHGGDKPAWILDMFEQISKYKNIKIAVWFNANDIDPRPEMNGRVSRPYVLDETPETVKAFREGIAGFKK